MYCYGYAELFNRGRQVQGSARKSAFSPNCLEYGFGVLFPSHCPVRFTLQLWCITIRSLSHILHFSLQPPKPHGGTGRTWFTARMTDCDACAESCCYLVVYLVDVRKRKIRLIYSERVLSPAVRERELPAFRSAPAISDQWQRVVLEESGQWERFFSYRIYLICK